jgi:UDP-N-acetylmuramoyl-tripeptide--D-alanyl-D-alanine ligase
MNSVVCDAKEDMTVLTVDDIIAATGGEIISRNAELFTAVCIDSRKVREGELFVALKGERFDGHAFLSEALEKAAGAIVNSPGISPIPEKTIILVRDTLLALQDIARSIRARRAVPVVAVTGSNGKTTTKELTAAILGTQYRILKNSGNLNNHIGLPLSLTKMSDEDQIIVLEMGASAPGEIRALCAVARPDYGVLTNISRAHLQGFRDIETVRDTKLELLETAGVAVVNADDHFLMEGVRRSGFAGMVKSYGIASPSDVQATDIRLHDQGSDFHIRFEENHSIAVSAHVSGMFNVYNILAAASIGYLFGIDPIHIKGAIEAFRGVPMRMEFREFNGVKIISDMYNANPASMEAALRELARIRKGRSIAVLGDMLELGSYEEKAHREVGRLMSGLSIDILITVGQRMAHAVSEFSGIGYKLKSAEEAGALLRTLWETGDTVLIKGSRGMHMERVLEA